MWILYRSIKKWKDSNLKYLIKPISMETDEGQTLCEIYKVIEFPTYISTKTGKMVLGDWPVNNIISTICLHDVSKI